MQVPFNRPVKLPNHSEFFSEALTNGHLAGNGPFTKKCEDWLNFHTRRSNLLVSSGTHALELMGLLLEIQPGDEVIVPSFTFVSSANAFALRGAKIIFADNDAYGNIIPSEIERLYTPRTRAVLAVHYAGHSADMDELKRITSTLKIHLLEDGAQAIGGAFQGTKLGTFGSLGCYSFHETKNVSAGEGGGLIINQEDLFLERAFIIREKGTNRKQFIEGATDKYTWVGLGSSYLLSDLNAAYLFPQLIEFDTICESRKQTWLRYDEALTKPLAQIGASILRAPPHNRQAWHLFAIVFNRKGQRNHFIHFMREAGITTPFHYVPLHQSPYGCRFYSGGVPETLPGCEAISGNLVRLPLFYNITLVEQDYVITNVLKWLTRQ